MSVWLRNVHTNGRMLSTGRQVHSSELLNAPRCIQHSAETLLLWWTVTEPPRSEVGVSFSACTVSVCEGRSNSILSLEWARHSMDKLSILGICMSIADKWLREKERPSVSFLRGMISLLVLLAYLGISVFSNTRACRGGYGDPFRTDMGQYP